MQTNGLTDRHTKGWMERVLIYVQQGCKHT